MFKSALPLALATSPLLLAAAQPPVLESIGPDCSLVTNGWTPNGQDSLVINTANSRPATAQPISAADQALVNSQDELSVFVDSGEDSSLANGWGTALRLLLDNPYLTGQSFDGQSFDGQSFDGQSAPQSSDTVPLTSENRCISLNKAANKAAAEDLSSWAMPLAEGLPAKPLTVALAASSPIPSLLSQAPETSDEVEAAVETDGTADAEVSEVDAAETEATEVDAAETEASEVDAAETENPVPLPELDMQTAPAGRTPVQSVDPAVPPTVQTAPANDSAPINDNSVPSPRMPAPTGVVPDRAPVENPNNFTPTGENPTPFDGTVATTLESLPDGNYRYLAGEAESRAYTNEELRQRGGSVFVLSKTNGTVTGDLLPRIGLPGICVTGSATGNLLTGAAYPYDTTDSLQDSAREIGETFEPHGSGALQIRRTRTENDGLYYADARLDLSDFTLINAGSSVPPTSCAVGRTGGRDQP